jgi:hypothetical protein
MKQILRCSKTAGAFLVLLTMLCLGQNALAQNRQTIKGVIKDARNKEPILGAVVRLSGTNTGTATDINGAYTLTANVPNALLLEVYKQRCAELYLSGLKWEDTRRFDRPAPPADLTERNRIFYPYPDQERLNNPNTPADPAI